MIVYKTTNLINGKIYIGKDAANNPRYLGSGFIFRRAIEKYGRENFQKEILEQCDSIEQLNEREKFWISQYNSTNKSIGYNIMDGGHGGNCKNYRYGINHPYFGKKRPSHIGAAIANSNQMRPKQFGEDNKSYKSVDSIIKEIILRLSSGGLGRDKIYLCIKEMGLQCPSPRTITRRLKEWNNHEYAAT